MSAQYPSDAEATRYGCELCGETAVHPLYTTTDRLGTSDQAFSIAVCKGCGVQRTLPDMNESELAAFYPADYWGTEPSEDWIRSSQSEKTRWLRRCGLTAGRILDVGCGAGFFLRALEPNRWDRFGVETGNQAFEAAAGALGRDRIVMGTLLEATFAEASFDVITFWSALEHMNAPRANLIQARRLIKPGGSLIVQVPNAASYQARLFGGHWFALDAPRHRYHFTTHTLEWLLKETGFEPYRMTFFSKAHNAHALRQSLKTTLCDSKSRLGSVLFYLSIPLIKPFDGLLTALGRGATITCAARAIRKMGK